MGVGAILLPIAQGEGGESGNFLVTPNVGLMIWTLLAFLGAFLILRKAAFPRIQAQLDKRRKAIEESIDHAEKAKHEADQLLEEYRARLREAREQAEDIVVRARRASDSLQEETKAEAQRTREELMERARRDIETETRRSLDQIRREVANLTVLATEKVTRRSLSEEDHRELIEEALEEVDFSVIGGENGSNGDGKES
jgi:F-type H+-transporting ATPase subunit b